MAIMFPEAVIPATMIMYGLVSSSEYIVDQTVNYKNVDPGAIVWNFAGGSIGGVLGGIYTPIGGLGRSGLRWGMSFSGKTMFQGETILAQIFVKDTAIMSISNTLRTFSAKTVSLLWYEIWEWLNQENSYTGTTSISKEETYSTSDLGYPYGIQ